MAEVVLFHIKKEIINKLGALTAQEVALWWGLKDQLRKLNDTFTRIKAVIQDAEVKAQNKQNHQIEDWYCPSLKGWWKKSRGEMKDDSDESTVEEELTMLSFPRLSSLTIEHCPNLTSLPLFPTLDEYLYLYKSSSMPLQQTMKMKPPVYSSSSSFMRPLSNLTLLYIRSIDDMESLPEVGLQNLTSLQQLEIRDCSRLKSLPLHGQGMPSLHQLIIYGCPRLESLSESKSQAMIPYLPSLQQLRIDGCSEELSRGWGKESSEVWPNIKHIPNIVID